MSRRTGSLVPPQMYDHECNVLKGWWHLHAIDKVAQIAEGEVILAGQVCYLDQIGEARLGLPDNCVPMIAWPSSVDYDVEGDVGNIQTPNMMALPCVATYEVQTTEFDADYTYHVQDHLTAWDQQLVGYTAAKKGLVRPGSPYQNTLCGVVTAAVAKNEFKKDWLSFWTYYLPVDLAVVSSPHA